MLELWQRLLRDDHAELRHAAAEAGGGSGAGGVAVVAKLRKRFGDPELVRLALSLTEARRKAAAKFGDRAETLVADPAGVEQASSLPVAAVKAQRFAGRGVVGPVVDLCCGIGGDTLALTRAGCETLAVDHDPVRAWMARQNSGAPAVATVVGDVDLAGRAWHIDPGRRTERGRVFNLAGYQPGPDTLRGLLANSPDAAIKLSPAVNLDELAETLPEARELQFISEAGRLVQSVAWFGGLADPTGATRSATRVVGDAAHHLAGEPDPPGEPEIVGLAGAERYLFTVDPAVERAGLMSQLGLPAIHPSLGLLTADAPPPPSDPAHPWLTAFERLADMPLREKKLAAWLRDHGAGVVEVKTRGKAVDPDRLAPRLRGRGDTPYTVFALRFDRQLRALITRRVQ